MQIAEISFAKKKQDGGHKSLEHDLSIHQSGTYCVWYIPEETWVRLGKPDAIRTGIAGRRLYLQPATIDEGFVLRLPGFHSTSRVARFPSRLLTGVTMEQIKGKYDLQYDEDCGLYYVEVDA